MHGVLNIDKPAGMTSHDVVAQVRRLTRIKRVGHAGTLDPDATGVLVVCVGHATRIVDLLTDEGKEYEATLALGTTTTTEDASGEVLMQTSAEGISESELRELLPSFTGSISQIPPMVSAVHHEGKRLYELARAGITVDRPARKVQIDRIELLRFCPGPSATAELRIACGKGTYIRTLCADIGDALEVGGHMARLRRTRSGSFLVSEAVALDALTRENWSEALVPAAAALSAYPAHVIASEDDRAALRQGRSIVGTADGLPTVCVLDQDRVLIALARGDQGFLHPYKVFL